MVIFLYGQDSYRSRKKLNEIVQHYKNAGKSGLNLIYYDASQMEFSDFYYRFKVSSMFAEKKLVIVKNLFSNKQFQEDFLEELKNIEALKDVVVVYEEGEVDQRLKLFKTLLKECKCQEFKLLEPRQLKVWTQKEFEKLGAKINMDALELLVSYVGNDLWRMCQETKKITSYKEGAVVKKEDVEFMVKPRVELDIFKMIDALAQKDKKQALNLLQKHINNGDNPLYLLSMITYQFRNLLLIKELADRGLMYASIVKKSGLHPFVVKKNYFACVKFSFDELRNAYKKIFKIDSDIKIGRVEPETAIDLLVASI